MAKKKVKKAAPKKAARPQREKAAKRPAAAAAAAASNGACVVLYELRDLAGVVRYHSEHADINRARVAAQHLANSPDVSAAWIVTNVESVRNL